LTWYYFDGFGDADQDGWSDLNDVDMADITLQMTSDQIIDNMLLEIPTEIKQMFDSNYAVVTKRYGLDLLAYEGGFHLTSYQFSADQQAQMHDLFLAVNQSPRMRDLYKAYLDQWQQSGGILFNQFVDVNASTKWGYWGALEYQNQDINTAPKYLGLMDFIQAQFQAEGQNPGIQEIPGFLAFIVARRTVEDLFGVVVLLGWIQHLSFVGVEARCGGAVSGSRNPGIDDEFRPRCLRGRCGYVE
jgi:hypothetical protein